MGVKVEKIKQALLLALQKKLHLPVGRPVSHEEAEQAATETPFPEGFAPISTPCLDPEKDFKIKT